MSLNQVTFEDWQEESHDFHGEPSDHYQQWHNFPSLLGHGWLLHSCVSSASPSQSLPPCWGAGLVHVRVLNWAPPPQEALQSPNLLHSLQAPSTKQKREGEHMAQYQCLVIPFTFEDWQEESHDFHGEPSDHYQQWHNFPSLLGHGWLLHSCVSSASPSQSLPPCWGAGLVHVRVLNWAPPPQEALQSPNLLHSLQAPSTKQTREG